MKRIRVYKYEILGSVVEWPAVVDVSRNDRQKSWTLYFEYLDPEARYSDRVTASNAEDVQAALVEHNASTIEFALALHRVADSVKSETDRSACLVLAKALQSLPLGETDGTVS